MWYLVSLFNRISRGFPWLIEVLFEQVFYQTNLFLEVKTWLFLSLKFIVEILTFYQQFLQAVQTHAIHAPGIFLYPLATSENQRNLNNSLKIYPKSNKKTASASKPFHVYLDTRRKNLISKCWNILYNRDFKRNLNEPVWVLI